MRLPYATNTDTLSISCLCPSFDEAIKTMQRFGVACRVNSHPDHAFICEVELPITYRQDHPALSGGILLLLECLGLGMALPSFKPPVRTGASSMDIISVKLGDNQKGKAVIEALIKWAIARGYYDVERVGDLS